MPINKHSNKLRELGLTPTIQRMAVLDCLVKMGEHPTADQVLVAVRETFPTVSRATVYNTLQALTKAGIILQITVDPAVSRYDADLSPHAHFRCRICNTVYDVGLDEESNLEAHIEGHHIEAAHTYIYGVCKKCLAKTQQTSSTGSTKNAQERLSGATSPSDSSAQPAQRRTQSFSDEPTKNTEEKLRTAASPSNSPIQPTQRGTESFSDEPTKSNMEKPSKMTSLSDSPNRPAQRKTESLSGKPTKSNMEKPSKMTSLSDSPSEKGGELPNARTP